MSWSLEQKLPQRAPERFLLRHKDVSLKKTQSSTPWGVLVTLWCFVQVSLKLLFYLGCSKNYDKISQPSISSNETFPSWPPEWHLHLPKEFQLLSYKEGGVRMKRFWRLQERLITNIKETLLFQPLSAWPKKWKTSGKWRCNSFALLSDLLLSFLHCNPSSPVHLNKWIEAWGTLPC